MNNMPVSRPALGSSDKSGMSLYTSSFWVYKSFIIPIYKFMVWDAYLPKIKSF